jgi:ABC-2 type transport system ATP-binding protein
MNGGLTVPDASLVPPRSEEPCLIACGLRKTYGEIEAVRGIDLTTPAGKTVALLGPNGAGKSTTIDMLLGLSRPSAGSVSVFGLSPVAAVSAGRVGAMLQGGIPPDHLRVRELIELTASYYPQPRSVGDVLQETGADVIADRWTRQLSPGQVQRVRFATALVGDPDLLVLDEPTAGMDVTGRSEFWRVVRGLSDEGKTIVFATHYLEEADAHADRVVLIDDGCVIADGSATEIKQLAGSRTIRATVPGADGAGLLRLPGVTAAEQRDGRVVLSCTDSDAALRALLLSQPDARGIEVHGSSLEEVFFEMTNKGRRR